MKTKMKKAAKPMMKKAASPAKPMMRKGGKVLPKHQTSPGQTGTPFQQLLKNNPSFTPSDTLAAGMPGSTYQPDVYDFAGRNARIGAANKATYGREDTSDITTPAEEKKAREGNYRLTRKAGGSMYKKGGSVTGKPMIKKSASMKSKTSKKK